MPISTIPIGGVPTEIEVYEGTVPHGRRRLEIAYDPAVGYLPRRLRQFLTYKKKAYVIETYVVQSRPCKAGGFVSTEWYDAAFLLDHFQRDYPAYDELTALRPPAARVTARHFRVTAFQDKTDAAALTQLKGVHFLSGVGGYANLGATSGRLTLANMRRSLGRKLTDHVPMPTVAVAELHEFDPVPRSSWHPLWIAVGVTLAVASLFYLIARGRLGARRATLVMAFLSVISTGCDALRNPTVALSATFESPTFVYDAKNQSVPMKLLVNNDGNQKVQIFKVKCG